jgi:two-component system sensor histidine kinase KdpD
MDFRLMEQAITNLLRNEAMYTPPGTTVEILAKQVGDECVITVADKGPGFPEASGERLFEKFYRIPGSPPGGTGLGLSIAKGFVEAHRGTITAGNREGGGAEFVIRLPAESQPASEDTATHGP